VTSGTVGRRRAKPAVTRCASTAAPPSGRVSAMASEKRSVPGMWCPTRRAIAGQSAWPAHCFITIDNAESRAPRRCASARARPGARASARRCAQRSPPTAPSAAARRRRRAARRTRCPAALPPPRPCSSAAAASAADACLQEALCAPSEQAGAFSYATRVRRCYACQATWQVMRG